MSNITKQLSAYKVDFERVESEKKELLTYFTPKWDAIINMLKRNERLHDYSNILRIKQVRRFSRRPKLITIDQTELSNLEITNIIPHKGYVEFLITGLRTNNGYVGSIYVKNEYITKYFDLDNKIKTYKYICNLERAADRKKLEAELADKEEEERRLYEKLKAKYEPKKTKRASKK